MRPAHQAFARELQDQLLTQVPRSLGEITGGEEAAGGSGGRGGGGGSVDIGVMDDAAAVENGAAEAAIGTEGFGEGAGGEGAGGEGAGGEGAGVGWGERGGALATAAPRRRRAAVQRPMVFDEQKQVLVYIYDAMPMVRRTASSTMACT